MGDQILTGVNSIYENIDSHFGGQIILIGKDNI